MMPNTFCTPSACNILTMTSPPLISDMLSPAIARYPAAIVPWIRGVPLPERGTRRYNDLTSLVHAPLQVCPAATQLQEGTMPTKRKNVIRFDLPVNPAFDQRLAHESDIDLTVCARAGPEAAGWAALERSHVYHVSAAKDELPRRWFVSAELLQRCPTLLCVSSAGAGYDTVDVAACTKAGVAVMNQAGGNANSVAEHAFGLMLALSRRIIECDRRLRHEQGFSREDVMGHEIGGKVLGIIGVGHVGTRVAALAHAFGMTVLATDPYLTAVSYTHLR